MYNINNRIMESQQVNQVNVCDTDATSDVKFAKFDDSVECILSILKEYFDKDIGKWDYTEYKYREFQKNVIDNESFIKSDFAKTLYAKFYFISKKVDTIMRHFGYHYPDSFYSTIYEMVRFANAVSLSDEYKSNEEIKAIVVKFLAKYDNYVDWKSDVRRSCREHNEKDQIKGNIRNYTPEFVQFINLPVISDEQVYATLNLCRYYCLKDQNLIKIFSKDFSLDELNHDVAREMFKTPESFDRYINFLADKFIIRMIVFNEWGPAILNLSTEDIWS